MSVPTTPTKKAAKTAAKAASRPADKPEPEARDVRPHLQAWHTAQCHIDTIDAQTGPDSNLPAREVDRLAAERASHVEAQAAVETALA
jgi:hypothetical protein